MEVTVPSYKSYRQGDLSLDSQNTAMKTLPNFHSSLKFLFEKHCYPKKDALSAVKLDPAVLEAQVTVGARQESCQCQEAPNNAITEVPCDSTSKETPRKAQVVQLDGGFKSMLSMQRAALQSLSSQQFDLLLKYVDTLRKQRLSVQKQMECGFCKNNGEPLEWYSTHSLKDSKGRVRCPVLRAFCCRRCGATDDHAHTIKYCPENYMSLGAVANTDETTTTVSY